MAIMDNIKSKSSGILDYLKEEWDQLREEDDIPLIVRRLENGYYEAHYEGEALEFRKRKAVLYIMEKMGTAALQLNVVKQYLKELSDLQAVDAE